MAASPSESNQSEHSLGNAIDQGIAQAELTDDHRAFFAAHPRLLEAIRASVGPRHFALRPPALGKSEAEGLARLGLAHPLSRRPFPSLWFVGQKYLREQWGGGR
jgi:hypothetical protein